MRNGYVILTTLALGALLLGCGEPEVVQVTKEALVDEQPDVPTPADLEKVPPTDEEIVASEEEGVWAEHMGDVPWVIGSEKGLARAKEEGKPILFFYTATW